MYLHSLSTECIYCIHTALVHHCMAVQQLATLGQANKGGRCWYKVVPPSTIMHSAEADNGQAIHMNWVILCFYLEEEGWREGSTAAVQIRLDIYMVYIFCNCS